jgi:hypothetical protein
LHNHFSFVLPTLQTVIPFGLHDRDLLPGLPTFQHYFEATTVAQTLARV